MKKNITKLAIVLLSITTCTTNVFAVNNANIDTMDTQI